MPSLNKVLLIGNLTRDPDLHVTQSGAAVCNFGLAINERYVDKDGVKHESVCFVDVAMWGKRGEALARYLHKGDPVFVEGRLRLEAWEDQSGLKHSKLKVVASGFEFMPRAKGAKNDEGTDTTRTGTDPHGPKASQRTPEEQAAEIEQVGSRDEGIDVPDGEIPF